jgi:hypothetical protein
LLAKVFDITYDTNMIGVVRQDGAGNLFVETNGRRFESQELDAPEGLIVDVEPYTGVGDVPRAVIRWTDFESQRIAEATETRS